MHSPDVSSLLRILAILIFSATAVQAHAADDSRIEALEVRVAELEALVQQLTSNRQTESDALPPIQASSRNPGGTDLGADDQAPQHDYWFGGYVKFDAMVSDYSDGKLAEDSPGRQFYVPSTIPVGGEDFDPQTDFQARETRTYFKSRHVLDNGSRLGTHVEVDFFRGDEGDERISNSYQPRLRQAYFTYDNWLFGQTFSTFQCLAACPETLDFIGAADGTIFNRQAQVRYSLGDWQLALENPNTTVTPFGGGERIDSDDSTAPDFVARYLRTGDWGKFSAAAIMRQLKIEEPFADDTTTGYGLSLSGKHRLGATDDFRWMANIGTGIGRYLGLNTSNDAVLDATGNLEAVDQIGGYVAIRHFWSGTWRTNLSLSGQTIDNDVAKTGTDVTKDVYSVHLNLLYDPVPGMTVGAEWIYARREIESGDNGDMNRLLVSAKYVY